MEPHTDSNIGEGRIDHIWEAFLAVLTESEHLPWVAPQGWCPLHMKGDGKKDHRTAGLPADSFSPAIVFVPILLIESMKQKGELLGSLPSFGFIR